MVDAIVASLPAFPCGSHASITVSTKGADGSAIVTAFDTSAFDDTALLGETLAIAVSKPKNSFTELMNPKPEFAEALAVTTSVRPIMRLNIIVRINVECDEVEGFDIKIILRPQSGRTVQKKSIRTVLFVIPGKETRRTLENNPILRLRDNFEPVNKNLSTVLNICDTGQNRGILSGQNH